MIRGIGEIVLPPPLLKKLPQGLLTVMTTKRAIVTDSSRRAKAGPATDDSGPHPLRGATFVIGAAAPAQLPMEGAPEIAFAGRSNAGKSSAINALALRTRLAFASRTPGRTQQINLFLLRSGALIADLPGYGYAAVAKNIKKVWQDFLWHYTTTRSTLVALVLVVDSRHGLKDTDLELLRGYVPSGRPVLILATKADKLTTAEQRRSLRDIETQIKVWFPAMGNVLVQLFSSSTRQGVPEAERTIAQWLPDASGI